MRQEQTKTGASAHAITLPGALACLLGDRRVRGEPNPHGLVFPTVFSHLRDPRKTVATSLDQAGLSARDIAEYLGHADPSLTIGTYMSETVGGSRAADALNAVINHGRMCGVCVGSRDR